MFCLYLSKAGRSYKKNISDGKARNSSSNLLSPSTRVCELNLLHRFVSYTIKLADPRGFHVMQSNVFNLSI